MKFYCVSVLPVHTPVRTPMYELSLSQSDQRILCVFQSVYNNIFYYCDSWCLSVIYIYIYIKTPENKRGL